MLTKIFFLLSCLLSTSFSLAQTSPATLTPPGQSEEVCSSRNPQICVQLHFQNGADSKTEADFILEIKTPQDVNITDPKVVLWMDMGGMGHRGAPVDMQALGGNRFKITNVWFVMPGLWLVKVDFNFQNDSNHFEFPINIEK